MTNPTNPPSKKPLSKPVGITAVIMAAAAAVAPFTIKSEGTIHKAYLDPIGKPTICTGHTANVKMGDVATDAQCAQYLKEDMYSNMNMVLQYNPSLIDHVNALEAAGDFSFNAGIGNWQKSPMAAAAKQNDIPKMCNTFPGYFAAGTFDKPQPHSECKPKPGRPGKFLCQLPGLVTRRLKEKNICLTGHE